MDPEFSNRIGAAHERFVPGPPRGELIEIEHFARYWWATPLAYGRRVLDAGCGVGYGTVMLAEAGATETVGIDVSSEAVRAADAGQRAGASFLEGDLRALPFDAGRFDLVVCFEVIEHVDEQDTVIRELVRVLAPDGIIAMSSPNRDVYVPGNPHHVREYVPDELRDALARHFVQVELYRQHDWTATAILNDAQVKDESLSELHDVPVGKLLRRERGSEPYTIALAGRAPLPQMPGRVVLGGVAEIRAWLTELRTLREASHWSEQVIKARTLERDRARENVAGLERIEAQLRTENATLLSELEQVRTLMRDTVGSVSWRITQPLRALGRLRR